MTMQPKNERHAAVIETTMAAYDSGTRGGDLLAVFVDAADQQGARPPYEIIVAVLLGPALGNDRDAVRKALQGFNL
jgi:hypothetical protein